ncbi:MAG: hypothetical protein ACTSYX_09495 [Candidatus Thorarchaeota archaeon]
MPQISGYIREGITDIEESIRDLTAASESIERRWRAAPWIPSPVRRFIGSAPAGPLPSGAAEFIRWNMLLQDVRDTILTLSKIRRDLYRIAELADRFENM